MSSAFIMSIASLWLQKHKIYVMLLFICDNLFLYLLYSYFFSTISVSILAVIAIIVNIFFVALIIKLKPKESKSHRRFYFYVIGDAVLFNILVSVIFYTSLLNL